MNRFVGEKVAIVSNIRRRRAVSCWAWRPGRIGRSCSSTPRACTGPRTRLGEYMMKSAADAREGVDAVLVVVDGQHIGAGDRAVIDDVAQMKCPKFLAVNKTDLVTPEKLMPQLATLNDCGFDTIVSVSAKRGDNVDDLLRLLVAAMPEGPKYFPDDMITDQPERVMCAEIIREKALNNLRDEIPHGVGVEMLEIKKVSPTLTEIHANLYCERASHKSIIIGKQGAMLGRIGSQRAWTSSACWGRR